jgi:MFS family permease
MGSIALVGGVASMAFFGWIIDKQFSRGRYDYALRIYLISALTTLPLTIIGFLLNREDTFLLAMVMIKCVLCACYGPGMAIMQIITPPPMRGRAAALMLFTISVFGYAAGPMLAGALTDFVFRDPAQVGASIALIALVLGPVALWCLWSSRNLLKQKIASLEQGRKDR